MTLLFAFDNSYARLPERFGVRMPPTPVAAPELLRLHAIVGEEVTQAASGCAEGFSRYVSAAAATIIFRPVLLEPVSR